jgi:hypothetical protein
MSRCVRKWALDLGIQDNLKPITCLIEIPDLITEDDAKSLFALARGRKMAVDVGTFTGGSAHAILAGLDPDGFLYCIDQLHTDQAGQVPGDTPPWVRERILNMRLRNYKWRYDLLLTDSQRAALFFPDYTFDLVFIDANHSYNSVCGDIEAWWPKLKIGGIMCGHDMDMGLTTCSDSELEKNKDYDVYEGAHVGVMLALRRQFNHVGIFDLPDTTVWYTKKISDRKDDANARAGVLNVCNK